MRRAVVALAALTFLAACSNSANTAGSTTTAASTTSATEATTDASTTTEPATTTTSPSPTYAATIDELLHLPRPIVLAHTGGEANFPASTLFAYRESVKAGVDVLDVNVLLTKDGQLLVQHDDTVDRTTNGSGKVADLTFDQIHALDAAYWFTTACSDCHDKPAADYLYRGVRTGSVPPPSGSTADDFALPSLRQLVNTFPDIPLNIEIKGDGVPAKAAADELAKELRELHREKASVVASFQDDIVSYFHQIAPEVEVSPGLGALAAFALKQVPIPGGMRILQLPPELLGVKVITPELIAATKKAGQYIWVWPSDRTLENLDSYRHFLDEGLQGLNIDFPSEGVKAVSAYVEQSVPASPSSGCVAGNVTPPGKTTQAFTSSGLAGDVFRTVPPGYDGTTPLPLVLDLHGWSEPAVIQVVFSDLSAYGASHGFITLVPEISRVVPRWDTRLTGTDIAWIAALIDDTEQTTCVDQRRVYVTGMSNGAMMTSTLACTMADRIAAVATVAGVRSPTGCAPQRPIPLLAIHGTDDPFLAYNGGYGPKVAGLPAPDGKGTLGSTRLTSDDEPKAVPAMMAEWAARNGCNEVTTGIAVSTDVTATRWTCDAGADTELYTVQGGGHSWPGSKFSAAAVATVGPTTMTISANDIIWTFFLHHPLTTNS
jgi:poly(3-hydroxybutyrate) depolymerase/glycerophosphoryl diester phosphodiesterase